jgi:hypothetical protein
LPDEPPIRFVDEADVGACNGYTSEVSANQSDLQLKEHDLTEKYIDKASESYLGGIDVKLPDEDSDLAFKLCKLPSLAHSSSLHDETKYEQYARLMDYGKLLPQVNCDQIPSAIRLRLRGNYKTTFAGQKYSFEVNSIAITSGPAFR